MEKRECRIVFEHAIRTVPRNAAYLFSSLRWIVLAASVVPSTSADVWHLRMGHLNFQDMCKLKSKATGIAFVGEPCFCQTCVMAKMRRTPFQNRGVLTVNPKQNICFHVSGPFPPSPEGKLYSLNAICKATGKRWRAGGKLKSDAADFLMHL